MPKDTPEKIIDSPYVRGTVSVGGGGGGGGGTPPVGDFAPTPHAHESAHHSGLLNWTTVSKAGSDLSHLATRPHSALTGITADQHHPHVHPVVGTDALGITTHTATGLTVGQTVRATGATTFAWQKLLHTDLDPSSITADQHHERMADIIMGDSIGPVHTITGSYLDLVGAVATDTLGLVIPSSTPGNGAAVLRTNNFGGIDLVYGLFKVDTSSPATVSIDNKIFFRPGLNPGVNVDFGPGVFQVDIDNHWVGINKAPAGAALDMIAYSNADHTQRIKQKSGQTGRMWRVEDLDGNELIVLDSVGNLQSGRPGFVSGLTGWQMTPQGNLEANNIWARGELHATVFVKDEVHATGGTLLVATAATVHSDAQIDSAAVDRDDFMVESTAAAFPGAEPLPLTIETTSATFSGTTLEVEAIGNIIEINDPPSGPGLYFTPGEIVRVKTEVPTGITDFWFVVQNAVQVAADEEAGIESHNRLSVTHKSGGGPTQSGVIPKGAAIVSYGHPGDGRILMTSDWRSDEGYTPYIDVFNIGNAPWTGNAGEIIPRMRMGQLKGVGVPGTTIPGPGDGIPGVTGISQWGMIAGSDLTNANSGYLIASNLGIRMVKVPLTFNNGTTDTGSWTADGNIRIGKNIGQDATTGFRVITKSDIVNQEGNVIIGNEATGNYLRWDQFTGVLTVAGALVVTDPGTTVTKIYVDGQDGYYDGLSQGYGNSAFANSKVYVNDRRLVKVDGTWTSGTNVISWTTVALHFANSTTPRSVTNGNTGTLSVRMYLYVDLAQAGTLTMFGQTTQTVNNPNWALIAVCDPGANGTTKASVTVVGGSTYISGGNIFTQSIVANNIAVGTITANEIASNTILVSNLDDTTTSYITNGDSAAQGNAEAYANRRRVVGIGRTDGNQQGWGFGFDNNFVSWTSLTVKFADGSQQSITNGSTTISGAVPFTYLYVNVVSQGTTGPLTLSSTTSITALGPDHVVIAVVKPAIATSLGGSGWPSLTAVAGNTFISGDSIITGSIVAQNIAAGAIVAGKIFAGAVDTAELAAGAVTAGKIEALAVDTQHLAAFAVTAGKIDVDAVTATEINVASLAAIQSNVGNLIVNSGGTIRSASKASYAAVAAGFCLGWDTSGGVSAYKFDIGTDLSYLRWDGDELLLRTASPIVIHGDSTNTLFNFETNVGPTQPGNVKLNWDSSLGRSVFTWSGAIETFDYLKGKNLVVAGVGANPFEVITIENNVYPTHTGHLTYDFFADRLQWSKDFSVAQTLFTRFLNVSDNRITIETRRDISTSTPDGTPGDICWGWHAASLTWCLFMFMPTAPSGGAPQPGWFRVSLTRASG